MDSVTTRIICAYQQLSNQQAPNLCFLHACSLALYATPVGPHVPSMPRAPTRGRFSSSIPAWYCGHPLGAALVG